MAEHKSARFEKTQLDAISAAQEQDLADNDTEAMKVLINQGAADLGIVNGQGVQSSAERQRLKRVLQEVAEAAAYFGMAWGLVLMLYPNQSVNWVVLGPTMLALLLIVTKDLFMKYG